MAAKYNIGKLWEVRDLPGKGKGVVARVNIPRGSLILEDKPLFIIPPSAHTVNKEKLNEELDRAVDALNAEDKQTFWSLADSKSDDGQKSARGIYFTNCYSLGQGCSTRFPTAMLPILSRVNHSCRPNTEFHWDKKTEVEQLRASRDITAGEELTDCYLDFTVKGRITSDERKRLMKSGYGFECQCEACSLPSNLQEEDDILRTEAWTLSLTGFELSESQEYPELQEILGKAMRWYFLRKHLGYKVTHQLEAAEVVWHLAMILGDQETLTQISREGQELASVRFGPESEEARVWKEKLEDPVKYLLG